MARLLETFKNELVNKIKEEQNYSNIMEVPRLEKISVNIGLGEALQNKKLLDTAVSELEAIVGQKVMKTVARKSVSNFKLREGNPIGAKVTLRGKIMYEFFDRLVNVALPRVRDFKGVSQKSFDGRGNYAMGVKEHIIFPEINYDKVEKILGMDIIFVTSAKTDSEARELLKYLGMPFRK